MKARTGHILIVVDDSTRVEPATFIGRGLAVHPSIGTHGGYSITHVRSGLALRTRLSKRVAYRAARILGGEDWTFAPEAVTVAHAERVRAVVDGRCSKGDN